MDKEMKAEKEMIKMNQESDLVPKCCSQAPRTFPGLVVFLKQDETALTSQCRCQHLYSVHAWANSVSFLVGFCQTGCNNAEVNCGGMACSIS